VITILRSKGAYWGVKVFLGFCLSSRPGHVFWAINSHYMPKSSGRLSAILKLFRWKCIIRAKIGAKLRQIMVRGNWIFFTTNTHFKTQIIAFLTSSARDCRLSSLGTTDDYLRAGRDLRTAHNSCLPSGWRRQAGNTAAAKRNLPRRWRHCRQQSWPSSTLWHHVR